MSRIVQIESFVILTEDMTASVLVKFAYWQEEGNLVVDILKVTLLEAIQDKQIGYDITSQLGECDFEHLEEEIQASFAKK